MIHTHHGSRRTTELEPVRGLKSLNSHSIENEVVRIHRSNSGKSNTCTTSILEFRGKIRDIAYWDPIVSWSIDTSNSCWRQPRVTQGSDLLFAKNFLKVGDISLTVMIL